MGAAALLAAAGLANVPSVGHAVQPGDAQRFDTWTGYDAGRYVVASTAADFNGDGAPDIAWGRNDFFENEMSVQLNFGEGTMRPAEGYPAIETTNDIASGDLDGDGDIDIVAVADGTSLSNSTIDIYMNQGDGSFTHTTAAGGDGMRNLALADLSGDGAPDIAVTNYWSAGDVSVLINNGDGTFGAETRYATGDRTSGIVATDLTGDGALDLAVGRVDPETVDIEISVLENDGSGSFATDPSPFVIENQFVADHPELDAADFDGNGTQDLAMGHIGSDAHYILLNDGSANLTATSYVAGHSAFDVHAVDIEGDGDIDLASADGGSSFTGSVSILRNRGDGTFDPAAFISSSHQPSGLDSADFNRDGILDLAVANRGSSTGAIHPGRGGGSFERPDFAQTAAPPTSLATTDFDSDGDRDVATSLAPGGAGDAIQLMVNNGSGALTSGPSIASVEDQPESLVAADLNGDTSDDLIWLGENGYRKRFVYAINNGDGTFGAPQAQPVTTCSNERVTAADADGDGDNDVLVATGSCDLQQDKVSISLNNGNGTFGSETLVSVSPLPEMAVGADVSGDGVMDIVAIGPAQGEAGDFSVALGTGGGTFAPSTRISTGRSHREIALADVDGDTDLDAVTANTDDTTTVLTNEAGTFSVGSTLRGEEINGLLNEVAVAVGDLNGDGAVDIAVANRSGNDAGVHYGRGDGTFDRAQLRYGMNTSLRDIALADLDGNGTLDIVVPNSSDGPSLASRSSAVKTSSQPARGEIAAAAVPAPPEGVSIALNLSAPVRCTITGTAGNDRLRGTPGPDVICARGGDDTVFAAAGNDTLVGGPGADALSGGSGNDTLLGGPGNDTLRGDAGTDRCLQGPGTGPRLDCES